MEQRERVKHYTGKTAINRKAPFLSLMDSLTHKIRFMFALVDVWKAGIKICYFANMCDKPKLVTSCLVSPDLFSLLYFAWQISLRSLSQEASEKKLIA